MIHQRESSAKALSMTSSIKRLRLLKRWTKHCEFLPCAYLSSTALKIFLYTKCKAMRLMISFLSREAKNLKDLKDLGHFLKGSSATLGLVHVRDNCEKIQNYGDRKDETGNVPESNDEVTLSRIKVALTAAKKGFSDVEKLLRQFYND